MLVCSHQVDILPLEGGALLIEHNGYEIIEGELAGQVLAAVYNGITTRQELAQHFAPRYSFAETSHLVDLMIRDGLLEEIEPVVPAQTIQRWQQTQLACHTIQQTLAATGVQCATGHAASPQLVQTLIDWGIQTKGGETKGSELAIIEAHGLFDARLAPLNRQFLQQNRPWLLLDTMGFQQAFFIPGKSGCWACLKAAVLDNRPGIAHITRRAMGSKTGTELDRSIFYERAAARIVQWLVEGSSQHAGHLWMQPGLHQPETKHTFVTRHNCPACGCATSTPSGVRFANALDEAVKQTGQRAPATVAVRRFEHLVSPVTGVLRAPCILPAVDPAAGNAAAIQHNMVQPALELERLRINTLGRSIGKGATPDAASASAIFEGLERFSGIWRPSIAHQMHAPSALSQESGIYESLAGYSSQQYETRTAWNAACTLGMLKVPPPLDSDKEIAWVTGYSLVHERKVLVPAEYCFYDYPDADAFLCDSNGCAAGTTYADAMLAGLCELIERDAVAMWWYNKARRPEIDLDDMPDPFFGNQQTAFRQQNRSLQVLDLTTGFEIPVVVALSIHKNNPNDILMGFGCHWHMDRAIKSALLELNQVRCVRALTPTHAPLFDRPLGTDRSWIEPEGLTTIPKDQRATWPPITVLIERLAHRGFDVVAVDQTHPDIGLPVVRMIVPGLCHHWRRLGVRRLYEAPVSMGWTDKVLSEHTINPATLVL